MFDLMTPKVIAKIQSGIQSGITSMEDAASGIDKGIAGIQTTIDAQVEVMNQLESGTSTSTIPETVDAVSSATTVVAVSDDKTADDPNSKIEELKASVQTLNDQIDSMKASKSELIDMVSKMNILVAAIPEAFETAKDTYLTETDKLQGPIEDTFQQTMNGGFQQLYLTVTIVSILAFCILLIYKKNKNSGIAKS